MFPIILVFILRESVDRSDNPTSRRNMNSRIVCYRSFMVLIKLKHYSRGQMLKAKVEAMVLRPRPKFCFFKLL